jgi:hypothetical protein
MIRKENSEMIFWREQSTNHKFKDFKASPKVSDDLQHMKRQFLK